MISSALIQELAELLESAEREGREIVKITDAHPEIDIRDAYLIQQRIRHIKETNGHRAVGFKAGLTSRAKMLQMGVDSPITGFLCDYFSVPSGGEIKMAELIHPKVEPEIAFVLKKSLKGPGCHVGTVLAATDFVVPALEIIDSRYRDFKFDLPSVIADNCSSSRFVIGEAMSPVAPLDLCTLGAVMEKNGEVIGVGAGAAVLGHPAAAVAMMANSRCEEIPAGSLVLSGAITEAIAVKQGDSVRLRIQDLGTVSVRFV
ncbi:MAG: 2-oxo-3-hexenedioate decarboxylase [Acidobacteriota bacterium]|nr:2-oxo-3-hexenedioate decarboxylase [Acidobacteriota bacterium]